MVWSLDKVRREHARVKSIKSSIDEVQRPWGRSKLTWIELMNKQFHGINVTWEEVSHLAKEPWKMEGCFKTIEGRGGGIVGFATGLFWFLTLVVRTNFCFNFLPFFRNKFSYCSVLLDYSSFFWTAWFCTPENLGDWLPWWHQPCCSTRWNSVKMLCGFGTLYRLYYIMKLIVADIFRKKWRRNTSRMRTFDDGEGFHVFYFIQYTLVRKENMIDHVDTFICVN